MRELRDTRQIKAWLKAGKTIELRDRNRVIARILPQAESSESSSETPMRQDWPDFEADQREIFGDRMLNAVADFLEDRGRY